MVTLRMLVLTLLVVLVTSSPSFTSSAEASSFDEAQKFGKYLCESYLWCG
jgi:hypothetical protein